MPGNPRHRVVASRFDTPAAIAIREGRDDVPRGTVTDAETTSHIPLEAMWCEVEQLREFLNGAKHCRVAHPLSDPYIADVRHSFGAAGDAGSRGIPRVA